MDYKKLSKIVDSYDFLSPELIQEIKRIVYDHLMGSGFEGLEIDSIDFPKRGSTVVVKLINPYGYNIDSVLDALNLELLNKGLILNPGIEFYDNKIKFDIK